MVLEAALHADHAEAELAAWRDRVAAFTAALGWRVTTGVRRDGARATLAFTVPGDALLTATLINEWAWIGAATDGTRRATATMAEGDERLPVGLPAALERVRALLAEEREPAPRAPDAAIARPAGTIPVALVTGSNGKTTTVRLIAAMLARAGHTVGFCCSDGVFIDGTRVEEGDWSGPAGAQRVLDDPRVTAAVLETARGGLLRRGLAVERADAAIVTNIAEDHLGGYGIHSLADLAEVKLVVARALGDRGTLVLNGDDETLRTAEHRHRGPVEWFRASAPPAMVPPATEMPLAHGGAAAYNVMNAIGAATVARALGVPDDAIAATLRTFGADNADNPGRLERFHTGGVRIWIDYAHNPHGLAALMSAARTHAASPAGTGPGRLGLLLGQAGDRQDDAIRSLARTAWEARPERIVLKDLDGYLRGRSLGEVPGLLRAELLAAGADPSQLEIVADETSGVRALLAWSRPGDLLVLLVHALEARSRAIALLTTLEASGWIAGEALGSA